MSWSSYFSPKLQHSFLRSRHTQRDAQFVYCCSWRSWFDKHLLRLFEPGGTRPRPSCCTCTDTTRRPAPGCGSRWAGWLRGLHGSHNGPGGGGHLWWRGRRPATSCTWEAAFPSRCRPGTGARWGSPPSHWKRTRFLGSRLCWGMRQSRVGNEAQDQSVRAACLVSLLT